MDFLSTYILTWRLPVALAIAALAIFPIRTAYRKLRISDLDILDNGAVEQSFCASLWIGIAAWFYPYVAVLVLSVWICLWLRHLLTFRAWLASIIALAMCAFWYYIING